MSIKFTELPDATLPLTGAEILALVQGSVSKQATVADIGGSSPVAVFWTGVAVAALAAGDNNNLITDISVASRLAVTLAADANLTGKAGGSDGKLLHIQNRDAVDVLTIITESGLSLAANRFAINGDLIVPPLCGALFLYDGTISRWVKT